MDLDTAAPAASPIGFPHAAHAQNQQPADEPVYIPGLNATTMMGYWFLERDAMFEPSRSRS